MRSISLNEFNPDTADFFKCLTAGEPCAITDAGETLAIVIGMDASKSNAPRPAGLYAGQITIAPDFNDPLPDWEEALDRAVI